MRGQFGHRNPQINHFLCCYCYLHKERYCYIVNYTYFVLCSLISVLPAGRRTNFINILYPLISTSLVPFQLVCFCYRMFLNIYACRVYYLSHDCNIVPGHYHIANITRKHYAWISYHHNPDNYHQCFINPATCRCIKPSPLTCHLLPQSSVTVVSAHSTHPEVPSTLSYPEELIGWMKGHWSYGSMLPWGEGEGRGGASGPKTKMTIGNNSPGRR